MFYPFVLLLQSWLGPDCYHSYLSKETAHSASQTQQRLSVDLIIVRFIDLQKYALGYRLLGQLREEDRIDKVNQRLC